MPPIHISIPEPCSESWGAMTAAEKGRYCDACSKVVMDLTEHEPKEILSLYEQADGNMCGRFRSDQLAPEPPIRPVGWLKRFLLAIVLAFGAHLFVFAQAETEAAVYSAREQLLREMHPQRIINHTVTVRDAESGAPIAGAKVMVVGATSDVKWTDEQGVAMVVIDRNEVWRLPLVVRIKSQDHQQRDLIVTETTSDWLVKLFQVGKGQTQKGKPTEKVHFRLVEKVVDRALYTQQVVDVNGLVAISHQYERVKDTSNFSETALRDDLEQAGDSSALDSGNQLEMGEPFLEQENLIRGDTIVVDTANTGEHTSLNDLPIESVTKMGEVGIELVPAVKGDVKVEATDTLDTLTITPAPPTEPVFIQLGKPRIVPENGNTGNCTSSPNGKAVLPD